MRKYWTVHINNFYDFITYIEKTYSIRKRDTSYFRIYYKYEYLYLGVDDTLYKGEYSFSYSPYDFNSSEWYKNNAWEYMGNYETRKDKLKRLNNISNYNK